MRARNIKPSFFKNELLGEADPAISILFVSMWCLADREGRLEDRPKRIKAETFPYRDNIDVDKMLSYLEDHDFIMRYEVDGKKYIYITNFHKHQNPHHMEVASIIPPPNGIGNKYNHIPLSVPTRKRIYKRDGHKCVICGSNKNLSIDHITPISKGGSGLDNNLRTLCMSCNSSKKSNNNISHKRYKAIKEKMSTSCTQDVNEISNLPFIPLNPDSLNPDSLNPDSLNHESVNLSDSEKRKIIGEWLEQFWNSYPKKIKKALVEQIFFDKFFNIHSIDQMVLLQNTIMDAVEKQKPHWKEPEYIPGPDKWLIDERWKDEITKPKTAEEKEKEFIERMKLSLNE